MLVLVGALGHHHRGFAHTGQFQEPVLDLADFNPEAADLDLRVAPPQKLELSARQPAAIIAAAVHALTRAKRILQERTQRAFLQDPLCPGQRMYRSGDYGRGLPGGKLEFLGRRDSQVKISGFRIEISEIENRLLKLPGVREAAVVVTEGADKNKHLVAFCSGDSPLEPRSSRREEAHANSAHGSQSLLTSAATVQGLNPGAMRDQLAKALPAYMVPSAIHWRKPLPLTENGKIDRKALLELAAVLPLSSSGGEGGGEEAVSNGAGELDVPEQRHEQPSTATERRLAAAWAEVLGIPEDQIGRRDHFFELGGVSLSALRLAIALERAVSFKDLTAHPILADQAALIDERIERGVLAAPQG